MPILFHKVIINKCICHRFHFVHCKQFSQLNESYICAHRPKLRSSPKLGQLTVLSQEIVQPYHVMEPYDYEMFGYGVGLVLAKR